MAVRAHGLYRNPYFGKALVFSAVGHGVALMMLLVSPRWFPVPDTSASTMDAIEVQLFSAIVSGSAPPEPKPATPPPVAEPETEKAAAHVSQVEEMPEAPESLPATVPVNEPDSVVPPTPEPVQVAEVATPLQAAPTSPPVAAPKAQPDPVVPPKPEPVRVAKVDRVPAPGPKLPTVSVKESKVSVKGLADTLLNLIKAGMNVPEPMVPVAPLPEAPKLAQLSDLPAVLPKTMESPETSERVQETVKEALKNVAVPAPLKRFVPIQEARKLAKLAEIPEALPRAVTAPETQERVREVVQDTLKDISIPSPVGPSTREARKLAKLAEIPDVVRSQAVTAPETQERVREVVQDTLRGISIPSPVGPSASPREARKLAKLAEIPDVVRSQAATAPETQERVREVVQEALKQVAVPSPLEQPVPTPLKLAELPEGPAVLPKRESVGPARAKEQLRTTVTKALEKLEIPSPMADSEPLDVASLPPSAPLAPSVYSELKVISERNDAMAEERVAERQGASDADSSGSPPTMQQDAQWKKTFAEYAGRVKMVIDRNWYWQGNNNLELRVSVRFRIDRDGRATRVAIAKTSGNQIFDRAAIRAVKQLKRLPRFPTDIQREFLDVEMDFSKVRAS